MPDAAAALSEPLACVCNSLLDPPRIRPTDEVLVIGPGAIGLIAAQVAAAADARRVTVRGTERDGARLALAEQLGFETSVGGAPPEADVVVECSGAEAGIADALRAARPRGRIVQMGLRGADVTIPYDLICFHELTVSAGFASNPLSWRRAMAAAARRPGRARAAGDRGRAAARLARARSRPRAPARASSTCWTRDDRGDLRLRRHAGGLRAAGPHGVGARARAVRLRAHRRGRRVLGRAARTRACTRTSPSASSCPPPSRSGPSSPASCSR